MLPVTGNTCRQLTRNQWAANAQLNIPRSRSWAAGAAAMHRANDQARDRPSPTADSLTARRAAATDTAKTYIVSASPRRAMVAANAALQDIAAARLDLREEAAQRRLRGTRSTPRAAAQTPETAEARHAAVELPEPRRRTAALGVLLGPASGPVAASESPTFLSFGHRRGAGRGTEAARTDVKLRKEEVTASDRPR